MAEGCLGRAAVAVSRQHSLGSSFIGGGEASGPLSMQEAGCACPRMDLAGGLLPSIANGSARDDEQE
jgi:hypothetical protein